MTLDEAFFMLGLHRPTVEKQYEQVSRSDPKYFEKVTELFHSAVKAARKQKMLELHPDRNLGKDTTDAAARVNQAADALLKLKILPPPAPVVHFWSEPSVSWTNSATTSGFGSCWVNVSWR